MLSSFPDTSTVHQRCALLDFVCVYLCACSTLLLMSMAVRYPLCASWLWLFYLGRGCPLEPLLTGTVGIFQLAWGELGYCLWAVCIGIRFLFNSVIIPIPPTHTQLLIDHEDAVAPEPNDPLHIILKELGPSPSVESLLGKAMVMGLYVW